MVWAAKNVADDGYQQVCESQLHDPLEGRFRFQQCSL
jgi:hypothetical protein